MFPVKNLAWSIWTRIITLVTFGNPVPDQVKNTLKNCIFHHELISLKWFIAKNNLYAWTVWWGRTRSCRFSHNPKPVKSHFPVGSKIKSHLWTSLGFHFSVLMSLIFASYIPMEFRNKEVPMLLPSGTPEIRYVSHWNLPFWGFPTVKARKIS